MSKPSGAIDMTQGKPINLMLRFALPMMIGSIFQSLYSMVDSAVLGRFVGSHALAAIGATTSTTGLILLLATGVTSAISIVLSQYVGANDTDRVRKGIVASGWITLLPRRCSGSHQRFRRAAAHAAFKNAGRRHRHVRFIHSDCMRLRHRTVYV